MTSIAAWLFGPLTLCSIYWISPVEAQTSATGSSATRDRSVSREDQLTKRQYKGDQVPNKHRGIQALAPYSKIASMWKTDAPVALHRLYAPNVL